MPVVREAVVDGLFYPAAPAHEAQSALALVQPAVSRTQVALDAAVLEPVPPARGLRVRAHCAGSSNTIAP